MYKTQGNNKNKGARGGGRVVTNTGLHPKYLKPKQTNAQEMINDRNIK